MQSKLISALCPETNDTPTTFNKDENTEMFEVLDDDSILTESQQTTNSSFKIVPKTIKPDFTAMNTKVTVETGDKEVKVTFIYHLKDGSTKSVTVRIISL